VITFQKEDFNKVIDEVQPLWKKHYEEIALDKESIELNPHIQGYEELNKYGGLVIFTVREENKLIGYSFFVLQYSFHYKQLICAINDLFYILPEYRGKFLGSKLLKESEEILNKMGVHQVQMRTKVYANFGKILERAGYKDTEVVYRKNINTPKKEDING